MQNHPSKLTGLPTRQLVRAGLIAGIYTVLTLIAPFNLSFGPFQFRLSEAMTLLPMLTWDAIPGLAVGCLLANLLGGGVWFDVVFGALATLLAAIFTRRWRKHPLLGALSPVLFNGLIVGPVVYFAYVRAPGTPVAVGALLFTAFTVALGELAVCYLLGLPLYYGLKQLPKGMITDGDSE